MIISSLYLGSFIKVTDEWDTDFPPPLGKHYLPYPFSPSKVINLSKSFPTTAMLFSWGLQAKCVTLELILISSIGVSAPLISKIYAHIISAASVAQRN